MAGLIDYARFSANAYSARDETNQISFPEATWALLEVAPRHPSGFHAPPPGMLGALRIMARAST